MPLCPCQVPGYVGDCSRNECLVRSLTARAEKAEAAMTALYEEVARLRDAVRAYFSEMDDGWGAGGDHVSRLIAAEKSLRAICTTSASRGSDG